MRRRRLQRALRAAWRAAGAAAFAAVVAFLVLDRLAPFPFARLDAATARSAVVFAADDTPLAYPVARDDQRCRPVPLEAMGPWLARATIAVEDERFFDHPGVDVIAIARALGQNAQHGRVVSGASTLTMQLCRMMDDRPRTLESKVIEAFRAVQLERHRDKSAILEAYLNRAPYGGNVRGVDAAARRWFGRPPDQLALAEAALLAGLPQSPERLRPDRHPDRARARRDHVLERMHAAEMITTAQLTEARAAPVAVRPGAVDHAAPHAVALAWQRRPAGGTTTIDRTAQRSAEAVIRAPASFPLGTDVAVVVIDVERAAVVALVGSAHPDDPADGWLNGATAWRSPGSALKPFLYAEAFAARRLAPESIVPDHPIDRAGWQPHNFDRTWIGELTAADALRTSRNVSAILLTEALGAERCRAALHRAGVRCRDARPSDVTLAVGGTDVRLLDLTNAYATIARDGRAQNARLFTARPDAAPVQALDPAACRALDAILGSHARTPAGRLLGAEPSRDWFMWKTGTSAGRRDAWAVGHNRRYAIGVWVGHFDGTGHDAFVGATAAEPLLAALFAAPAFRRDRLDLPVMPAFTVTRAIEWPDADGAAVRITAPGRGARFVHTGTDVPVVLAANRPAAALTWFLNERVIVPAADGTIRVGPGTHALRCCTEHGAVDAVSITVTAAATAPRARGMTDKNRHRVRGSVMRRAESNLNLPFGAPCAPLTLPNASRVR